MDGLPIYKTNTKECWPILARVLNGKDSKPFAVSLFVGKSKPPSREAFLRPFLDELKPLMQDGLVVDDNVYSVKVSYFSFDAPARQFAKCIAAHNGLEGCERCAQKGVFIKG